MRSVPWTFLLSFAASERAVLFVSHSDIAQANIRHELARRSDPSSIDYLSWLTQEEVQAILQPDPTHLAAAVSLAEAHGAHRSELAGGDKLIVDFDGEAPEAFVRSAKASAAIDCVSAAAGADGAFSVSLASVRPKRAHNASTAHATAAPATDAVDTADPQKCLASLEGVTPTCLRSAYGLDGTMALGAAAATSPGQAFAVNQGFAQSDLARFQKEYGLPPQPVATVVGQNPGGKQDEVREPSTVVFRHVTANTANEVQKLTLLVRRRSTASTSPRRARACPPPSCTWTAARPTRLRTGWCGLATRPTRRSRRCPRQPAPTQPRARARTRIARTHSYPSPRTHSHAPIPRSPVHA